MSEYKDTAALVLDECRTALFSIDEPATGQLIERLLSADKIFITGVGRVLLSMQAFAKRLAHIGLDVHIVGDITEPAIRKGDLLIAASGSGETMIPKGIAQKAKGYGAQVVMIGSNRESTLAHLADLIVRVPTNTKLNRADEIPSRQIMTSLFEQFLLLYGDVIVKMIADQKNLDLSTLWQCHANLE